MINAKWLIALVLLQLIVISAIDVLALALVPSSREISRFVDFLSVECVLRRWWVAANRSVLIVLRVLVEEDLRVLFEKARSNLLDECNQLALLTKIKLLTGITNKKKRRKTLLPLVFVYLETLGHNF